MRILPTADCTEMQQEFQKTKKEERTWIKKRCL